MHRPPTLRQIQYFIAVAEAANFRRAAARLQVSQPTLTSQVAALEEALEVKLLERSHSGSVLTPAGRGLMTFARRVVEEMQGLSDHAASLAKGPAGTYRLGVTPTLGPYLLPYVLPELHRRYEALKFYVREGAPRILEGDLLAGDHDLVLTPLPVEAENLTVVPLFHEPLRLVMSSGHRLARRRRVDSVDLRGEPVLTLQEHHLFHRQVAELCDRLGARVLRDYEGTSLDTLRQMVTMGMGVAFLPALYVRSEIHKREDLVVTSVEGEAMSRTHALAWRRSSPAKRRFERIAADVRELVGDRLADEVTLVE